MPTAIPTRRHIQEPPSAHDCRYRPTLESPWIEQALLVPFLQHFIMSYSPQAPSSEEKKTFDTPDRRPAPSRAVSTPRGYSAWFGGPAVTVGPRIGPVLDGIAIDSDTDDSSSAILDKQIALEDGHAIQYRTCSWQKVRCNFKNAPFQPAPTTAANRECLRLPYRRQPCYFPSTSAW